MKTKNACILLLAALALTACKYDDSALWEQVNQNTERIAALEAWQVETNTNIQSLQTLLNTADYITAVTPITENEVEVGYTITFLNSPAVTIYNGKKGEKGNTGATGAAGATPQIGVTQGEDDNWYWTLNGELLTDTEGNPIRANGEKGDKGDTGDTGAQGPQGEQGDKGDTGAEGATDTSAPVPQLKTGASLTNVTQDTAGDAIKPEAIYLSVDGGETWTRVSGEDGTDGKDGKDGKDGDSFFEGAPTLSEDGAYYTFTLAGGTTFSVPRYTGIKLTFDTQAVYLDYRDTQPVNFTAEGSEAFTTDNLFIIAPDGWKAEVTLPTRAATEFILTVTAPDDATSGAAEGEILVMLDNGQGNTTIGRLTVGIKYTIDGTKLTARGLEAGKLAELIGGRSDLTSVTVTGGTLNKADWDAIKQSNGKLQTIDLEGATYEGDDKDKWVYKIDYSTTDNILMDNILKTVKLPQGITALGEIAFYGCTAMTTVTLPETLTSIGDCAFYGCTAMTTVTLPEGLTSIVDGAFYGCTAMTTVTLPETLTTIGESAFQNCEGLTSIDLPETLTSIGDYAFQNCKALTSIDLPDGLTTIGSSTFRDCYALKSIDLPEGLTSIGDYAFYECTALTTVTLPETLTSIGDYAFVHCTSLTSIDLPEGLTSIGEYAFRDCRTLTSIDLPEGLTTIGSSTFQQCSALESIDLPEGLTSIGYMAFYSCTALTSIDLPEGLTTIGESAFQNCNALTTVTCQATGVPDLGFEAFYGCSSSLIIYVPDGSEEAYKTASGWSAYSTKIQPIQ